MCPEYSVTHVPGCTEDGVVDMRASALNHPGPTGHPARPAADGRVVEERQLHIRGGGREPLTRAEIEAKFRGNCEHGGWPKERAQRFLDTVPKFFNGPLDLSLLRG